MAQLTSCTRRFVALIICLSAAIPTRAADSVTIAQLEQFLAASRAARSSDEAISDKLSAVTLSEQLTAPTFARLSSENKPGPKTMEQLELLAAASVFGAPPAAELQTGPAPNAKIQQQMIDSIIRSAASALHLLPDFLATRTTTSFDNIPQRPDSRRRKSGPKHWAPEAKMHFVGQFNREITYRNGSEIDDLLESAGAKADRVAVEKTLTTSGEFGPILSIILSDSFKGSVVWSRWQSSVSGSKLAVFHYSVPKLASHYSVEFCCYQESFQHPALITFRDTPAYQGDIYVDPAAGTIVRFTLKAALNESDPMMAAGISVDYDRVKIGDKEYICPVHGVAISEVHNLEMEEAEIVGPQWDINLVEFGNYHKFGSTAHVIAANPGSDLR